MTGDTRANGLKCHSLQPVRQDLSPPCARATEIRISRDALLRPTARRHGWMTPPPVLAVLASVGVVAPDADVTDLPAIVDVAAEADIALGIAPVMIAILIPVLAGVTRAHES